MSRRGDGAPAARLAVAVVLLIATALLIGSLAVTPGRVFDITQFGALAIFGVVGVPFVAVGSILGWRRHTNPIGWLFQAWGLVMLFAVFGTAYSSTGRPGGRWAAWLVEVIWHPAFSLLVFILLLFPQGRLPSPRWRPFAFAVVAVYAALAVVAAVSPAAFELYFPGLEPPFRLPGGPAVDAAFNVLLPAQLGLVLTAVGSLIIRFVRSKGVERQQVKWFVYGVVCAVVLFTLGVVVLGAGHLFPAFGLIPVTAGVAIMRYRLFEIDRLVSRTVAYAIVISVLAAVFFGAVTVTTSLLPVESDLVAAGSTLAVAALFNPLRRRVLAWVGRRFNRARYDAQREVDGFVTRLRQAHDMDSVTAELAEVVRATMHPTAIRMWMRHP